jgi:hypothetical protein
VPAAFITRAIALMMEAASTSETSVNFYQTTRRNNPEDSHLNIWVNSVFEKIYILHKRSLASIRKMQQFYISIKV